MTHPETDDPGYFRRGEDCVVRLRLAGIRAMDLTSSELPAIIFSLEIEEVANAWSVSWNSSYGCEGHLLAMSLDLVVEPGGPE